MWIDSNIEISEVDYYTWMFTTRIFFPKNGLGVTLTNLISRGVLIRAEELKICLNSISVRRRFSGS